MQVDDRVQVDDRLVAKISGLATMLLPPVLPVSSLTDALKATAGVIDSRETAWVPQTTGAKGKVLIDMDADHDLREHSDFVLRPVTPMFVEHNGR